MDEACAELNKTGCELSKEAAAVLKEYRWPGNVRELKNVIRRTVLLTREDAVQPEDIQFMLSDKDEGRQLMSAQMPLKELTAVAVREVERKAIKKALDAAGGNKSKAAPMLQIDYKTLLTKIKEYGIK